MTTNAFNTVPVYLLCVRRRSVSRVGFRPSQDNRVPAAITRGGKARHHARHVERRRCLQRTPRIKTLKNDDL